MRTIITIEDGKVMVQIDDQAPIKVQEITPAAAPAAAPIEHKSDNPRDNLGDTKVCVVCGKTYRPLKRVWSRSKYCTTGCRLEAYGKIGAAKSARERATPDAKYCATCRAFTTHDTKHHPQPGVKAEPPRPLQNGNSFLPGHEKSQEEIDSWRPAATTPTPVRHRAKVQKIEKVMAKQRAGFEDPWNCLMCRNAGDLCDMHQRMSDAGQRPPSAVKPPSSAGRGVISGGAGGR